MAPALPLISTQMQNLAPAQTVRRNPVIMSIWDFWRFCRSCVGGSQGRALLLAAGIQPPLPLSPSLSAHCHLPLSSHGSPQIIPLLTNRRPQPSAVFVLGDPCLESASPQGASPRAHPTAQRWMNNSSSSLCPGWVPTQHPCVAETLSQLRPPSTLSASTV